MVISQLTLAAVLLLCGLDMPGAGSIGGVVVNASRQGEPVGGAEVVLRVMMDGQFVIAAEGIADEQGRFLFDNIPADADYIYLPGANHDGIHYPASRVRLSAEGPHARVDLSVHETITTPNPLVVRRHHITIRPEAEAIRVTETLRIDNPSSETYVGQSRHEGGRATTLRLAIPSDFRRVTFGKEFYGRQFTVFEGALVTDIPWTPGERELAFTYVLPNDKNHALWKRPMDLRCEQLRIDVHSETPNEISCDHAMTSSRSEGVVTFESTEDSIPADHLICVQLQDASFSLANHGRWLALGTLLGLIVTTVLIRFRPGRPPQVPLSGEPISVGSRQAA